jgi:hypothetical protein
MKQKKLYIAVIHSLALFILPLFIVPFFQWYETTILLPNTDILGLYFMYAIGWFGSLILTIVRWVEYFTEE